MKALEKIDQIAYVRFASVYRQFADVNSFMQEIQGMLREREKKKITIENGERCGNKILLLFSFLRTGGGLF